MTETELRIAITAPAAATGLSVEQGLVDVMLGDLRSPSSSQHYAVGALPFLSYALLRTWEHREGTLLTTRAYAAAGGLTTGVQASAEGVFTTLTPRQQHITRIMLLRMVGVTKDGTAVRRRVSLKDLDAIEGARQILEKFSAIRLVTVHQDSAEIAHEALLRGWPRLAQWLDEDTERIRQLTKATDDALAWESSNHDRAFLYQGSRLKEALTALQNQNSVPPSVRDFFYASKRHENFRMRISRVIIILFAVITAMASCASFVAVYQRAQAQHQRAEAQLQRVAAQRALNLYKKSQKQLAALNLVPIHVKLSVNSRALLRGSPWAAQSLRHQILKTRDLSHQHAGLVLSFAGANDGDTTRALAVDSKIIKTLASLGGKGIIFKKTVYRKFVSLSDGVNMIELDVYLFRTS